MGADVSSHFLRLEVDLVFGILVLLLGVGERLNDITVSIPDQVPVSLFSKA